jgi:hypothetical protein
MAKPLGNGRKTGGLGRVALENIKSAVAPQQGEFDIAISNIARCPCLLKVLKPDLTVGVIGIPPGLGVQGGVMDQPGGVIVLIKNILIRVKGSDLEGMMSKKGWTQTGEVAISIEPLLDLIVIGFQVETGFGTIDQHDTKDPEVRGDMVVGGRFGQEVTIFKGGIEELANVR